MNSPKPMFVREVARIDDPQFVSGQVAGHRARRLIDAPDEARRMGDAGRRFVESWASPSAVAAAYEALFAELAKG